MCSFHLHDIAQGFKEDSDMSLELVKGRLYSCKSICICFLSRALLCLYREHPTLVRFFFFVSPLGTGKVLLCSFCSASGRGVNRTSCESPVYTIISPGVGRRESKGPKHISSLFPCFFFFPLSLICSLFTSYYSPSTDT